MESASDILVVDDETDLREAVCAYLARNGLTVRGAGSAQEARAALSERLADAVILDITMPGEDGLSLARALRSQSDIGIVMLTASSEVVDRVVGLEVGADDYVTKPFSPRELTLRIRSILRRAGHADKHQALLTDGDLVVDISRRSVTMAGAPVKLTKGEFDLLVFLMNHAGRTWTHQQLLERVWGWSVGETGTVTTAMARLRSKIQPENDSPKRIITSYGAGYRFERVGNDHA